jgi:hypothetical protein
MTPETGVSAFHAPLDFTCITVCAHLFHRAFPDMSFNGALARDLRMTRFNNGETSRLHWRKEGVFGDARWKWQRRIRISATWLLELGDRLDLCVLL